MLITIKKLEFFLLSLFNREAENNFRYLPLFWLVALYIAGAMLGGYFWGWGQVPLDYHDWVSINFPRLDVVRDALNYLQFPLHISTSDTTFLHGTNRFFALPDVITTPQMIFLKFLTLQNFVFFDIFIHYTIGFLSLLWFRRRFNLSLMVFSVLVLLFNFNGYILLHYIVGHFTWAGYFLFPAFFILMVEFVEKTPNWVWLTRVSLLLFYMVLAGSEHHFLWLLIFLGMLSFVERKKFFWGLAAMIFAGLSSAIRLIPPAFSASQLGETTKGVLISYDGPVRIFQMMVSYQNPVEAIAVPPKIFETIAQHQIRGDSIIYTLDFLYWEYALYIGVLATLFLVVFGILMGLKSSAEPTLKKFSLPAIFLLCMAITGVFDLLRITGVPFFLGERVSARMIAVPFVFLLIFATVNFQRWLDASHLDRSKILALIMGAGVILYNLLRQIYTWQISHTRSAFGTLYLERTASLSALDGNSLVNVSDPIYTFSLLLGLLITTLTIGFLSYKSLQTKRINR